MADRKDRLLQAGLDLASELSLPVVLQRIVEVAAEVCEARYGALGVLGEDGRISQFITTGLSPAEKARIGPPPTGGGILGVLIHEARPLRLKRIGDEPRSAGFPTGHPPMESFLGAPVKALGRVFGNIYLTEKRGGLPFSQEDEDALVILATQAGVAVANASLYEESRHRERWLEGLHDITSAILAGSSPSEVLDLVCRRARELVEADVATVVTRGDRPGVLVLTHADGAFAAGSIGLEIPESASISGEVMGTGRTVVVEDASRDSHAFQPMVAGGDMGHTVFMPLRVHDRAFGTLAIAHRVGGQPFSQEQLHLATTFADQASVALDYARVRADTERLAIMDDRERIARELHDGIIQSLFAVGMGLQGTATMSGEETTSARIESAVEEVDRVIRDLRNYIFGLRPGILADRQLDQALRQLAAEASAHAGCAVEVSIDSTVAAELASRSGEVVQLAREALSNASRHARASRIRLELAREDKQAVLLVEDDGSGFDRASLVPGQGLDNMRARVAALGGRTRVASRPGRGTRVRIALPI